MQLNGGSARYCFTITTTTKHARFYYKCTCSILYVCISVYILQRYIQMYIITFKRSFLISRDKLFKNNFDDRIHDFL
jgi:hypothetical protein